jgi:hypothetical protein
MRTHTVTTGSRIDHVRELDTVVAQTETRSR